MLWFVHVFTENMLFITCRDELNFDSSCSMHILHVIVGSQKSLVLEKLRFSVESKLSMDHHAIQMLFQLKQSNLCKAVSGTTAFAPNAHANELKKRVRFRSGIIIICFFSCPPGQLKSLVEI